MKPIYLLFIFLLIAQLILAFICGPHSCEWGNMVYFYFGVGNAAFAFILPLLQKQWPGGKRIGYSLLFILCSVIIWCVGFMLGGFRIMCRLF